MKTFKYVEFAVLIIINCMTMNIYSQDTVLLERVRKIREELHNIPEYSHNEEQTAALVESYLAETNPDFLYTGVGGHGVVAGYKGFLPGPSKMFRCELDAIQTSEGIRHWCGHDGHMAIMLGVARIISGDREFAGTVWLLFQPAEEVGEGAELMVKDLKERNIKFDYSFALHNKPGVRLNKVVLHKGVYAAGSVGMEIFFKGSPSHASSPEKAISPYRAIFETAEYMHQLNEREDLFKNFTLGTVVNISMGDVNYGVTPGEGYLRMTLRSFTDSDLDLICKLIEDFADKKAAIYSLEASVAYFDRFPATINDDEANSMVESVLVANSIDYEYAAKPEKGSDDFAFFAFNSVSSYFDIGNGTDMADLHQKGYRFSDEIMGNSIKIFSSLVYEHHDD
jgi:amidohydrolase